MTRLEDNYLRTIFLEPIRKCAAYKPSFGQGRGVGLSLGDFQTLYGGDSFYAWLGLDTPSVYAAHKAAGGLTSVYRQIGVGSERLFRAILNQSLMLSDDQMSWEYEYSQPDGKISKHTLDACIRLADLKRKDVARIEAWLQGSQRAVGGVSAQILGAVFEVRQGYKSADSKRQNADLRFGIRAYQAGLTPIFVIMSNQVSEPVIRRYRSDGMLVLTGILRDDPTVSTFAFFDQIVGYDLSGFFKRNAPYLRREIKGIVEALLIP